MVEVEHDQRERTLLRIYAELESLRPDIERAERVVAELRETRAQLVLQADSLYGSHYDLSAATGVPQNVLVQLCIRHRGRRARNSSPRYRRLWADA